MSTVIEYTEKKQTQWIKDRIYRRDLLLLH